MKSASPRTAREAPPGEGELVEPAHLDAAFSIGDASGGAVGLVPQWESMPGSDRLSACPAPWIASAVLVGTGLGVVS
jgi:hypothetical protein